MNTFDKLLKKPTSPIQKEKKGRFEKFNLKENPFPSEPNVNIDAADNRINGNIFEMGIREKEYKQIENNFLKIPQSDPGHLRMGFIMDTSYVGRGNGKSAFLINLHRKINHEFCLDISNNKNKCFSVYLSPDTGGRTKTFSKLIDLLVESIISSEIINNCLASIRLNALMSLDPTFIPGKKFKDEGELICKLNSADWIKDNGIDVGKLNKEALKNEFLTGLPKEFPLYETAKSFWNCELATQEKFNEYYQNLKRVQDRLEFAFSHMVNFFRAANFNGAFVLVDDFERIPDFQSARQKRDFALELRNCLYDGLYTNAKIGFYNFMLVLHAGVPRLIQEAWSDSGMEHRVPITPSKTMTKHIIPFKKLNPEHAVLLLKRYLMEFRIKDPGANDLFPFIENAVYKIAEISELNASKILKWAYTLMDEAAASEKVQKIDEKFVERMLDKSIMEPNAKKSIAATETTDLLKKAAGD